MSLKSRRNKDKMINKDRMRSKFNFIKYDKYKLLDYDKHKLYVYGGIRSNSPKKREPETTKWIEICMSPGDVMFDVGANIGAYSLVAAANGIIVYAFEPSAMNFVILLKNIIKNKLESKIIPLCIPLAKKHSLKNFNYYNMAAGKSIHVFGKPIDYKGRKFKPVFRQLMFSSTIDDLVLVYGLPCPNHIKLDVDGNELQILQGSRKAFERPEFKTICVEVIDGISNKPKVDRLLSNFGLIEDHKIGTRVNKIYKRNIKKSHVV